ncbi:acetate/propionate family kinase [Tunturibacter empetritectus]|uniref:Acetate kinase n=1 Tax=Tunturiibacter lichenicola TaxID=2051959 RepID=A0A7W8N427_9BACT|nr:acetate/propionate family kinase [Edaphobacter lichenicola]MBB5342470.1 acetate kinase [Edaphobacter lichenicola]
MHILVINSGSSSIKFSLFEAEGEETRSLFEGEVTGIGGAKGSFKFRDAGGRDLSGGRSEVKAQTAVEAIGLVVEAVSGQGLPTVDAVGYRVVHPGAKLDRHQRITEEVLKDLEEAVVFAPLHDPAVIVVIKDMMAKFSGVAHYACFDTVFHETMPEAATTYPIPVEYRERGVRRYGFHGLSCESIVQQLRAEKEISFPKRMAIAHLGSGCSVTALVDGCSIDTTMGLTPTGGVVMGTRPGDLDPGLVLYLLRQMKGDQVGALEKMLNHDAGMVALSGMPNDMKAVREAVAKGDAAASLAVEIFTRSVKKALGGFIALMGGVDAVVFAGGIGEHDTRSRWEILAGMDGLGISINSELNEAKGDAVRQISASDSMTTVLVVPAKEDWMIAMHVHRMAQSAK